ncbi:MAG: EAL domain-containing protein [Sinobacteraceae bacterium]|nr:EAL domain-containing protein [Nevskiaceae bacterium]MCP5339999.1 EAL domain-containing protein [Nevskiaceae bacterium]MCP5359344.1 EAL domain-containing protein [Nevskiaceae bacterium]MCP5467461.1 EAL domain-containing protein [Nevskiaceae bacterium]MCP5470781.1 EAL domain-containing protein [Nevskiaceae bacterium]
MLVTLGIVAVVGGLFWYHAIQDRVVLARVSAETSHALLERETALRAESVATAAAALVAPALAQRDRGDIARRLQPLTDDASLLSLVIIDTEGRVQFAVHHALDDTSRPVGSAVAPVRTRLESIPGAHTPHALGEARVELRGPTAADVAPTGPLNPLTAAQQRQIRDLGLGILAIALLGILAAVLVARSLGGRITASIAGLVRSTERLGHGDYSRPVDVTSQDELGNLQGTLERLRQRLRQTTITKDYLNSVLGSMTDAVFVTSPDGVIKVANFAACRLLGYAEEELIGKGIASMLDESERLAFDLQHASNDTRETLVRNRQGQTIPVSITGSPIANDDPQFQGVIFVARNITDRKRAERRIRYLARYDALTKIPNRMQFQHLLQQAIARGTRNGTGVALLYLDMDGFKEVNDTFGHSAGDRALEVLSERLTRIVPKEAVAGRLAGDEFAVFIDGLPAAADNRGPIAHLARSILDEVGAAYNVNQEEVFLTASIGIALSPSDAENVIDLIRNADAAMYASKQSGGNTFSFYVPEMNAAAVERLMLKSKLRRALERDEFVVRYQPKVDLRNGRIIGAEALLRWRIPGQGDISPSQFIPLAEETNLILEIGEWVLNRVCMDYRRMLDEIRNPGRISLNLSLKQLRQASFILRCRSVFRKHAVSPTAFELEITETTLMADQKRTLKLLDELYAMGLHLSIDDFGTGYSSLSALQQFPIGTLKIDQSFVRDVGEDENDATIVRTIIEMGRNLGMDVIAEGIESVKHLDFLRSRNCHYGQGRLFGETLTADELRLLMLRQESGVIPYASLLPAPGQSSLSA